MKLEKNKHDHKLTQWLKVGIFALLMLAPLFASLTQTLYVTLNKNAKDSYYGETINERQLVNVNINNLENNNSYFFENTLLQVISSSTTQSFINVNNVNNINGLTTDIIEENINRIGFYNNSSGIPYCRFYNNTDVLGSIRLDNTISSFYFTFISAEYSSQSTNLFNNFIYEYSYNKYSYLDNAFYYGVDQMTKSDLFNWTENTALYTGIKAMTDNLQVETNAIAILLTYWMILTIIYIIIDIVTNMFTFLTHMIVRSE